MKPASLAEGVDLHDRTLGFWDTKMGKVPRISTKTEIKVTVSIEPVKLSEITPARRRAWQQFWHRLISEAKAGER